MKPSRIFGIAVLGLAAIIGATALIINELRQPRATAGMVTPAVAIGGPFALTDHSGRLVTDADFRDRFMLIYFGYTYCPDVCPTELQEMAAVMDELGESVSKVVAVFYIVAMTFLGLHLFHGVWAGVRTLGLAKPTPMPMERKLALGVAILVWAGFIAVPLVVLFGIVN